MSELQAMVQSVLSAPEGAGVNQVVAEQPNVVVLHPPTPTYFLESAFAHELALLGDQIVDDLVPVDRG